jgi:hypothetical protein
VRLVAYRRPQQTYLGCAVSFGRHDGFIPHHAGFGVFFLSKSKQGHDLVNMLSWFAAVFVRLLTSCWLQLL